MEPLLILVIFAALAGANAYVEVVNGNGLDEDLALDAAPLEFQVRSSGFVPRVGRSNGGWSRGQLVDSWLPSAADNNLMDKREAFTPRIGRSGTSAFTPRIGRSGGGGSLGEGPERYEALERIMRAAFTPRVGRSVPVSSSPSSSRSSGSSDTTHDNPTH